MNSVWTDEEKDFIRKNAASLTDLEIALQLSKSTGRPVTLQSARKQRQKMKLRKCHGRGICKLASEEQGVAAKPKGIQFHINGTSSPDSQREGTDRG